MIPRYRVYVEFEVNGVLHKNMEAEASWFLLTQTGELWVYSPLEAPHRIGKEYKKAIPLFSTGIKDRKGKEIFEGDIVSEGRAGDSMWEGEAKLITPAVASIYYDAQSACFAAKPIRKGEYEKDGKRAELYLSCYDGFSPISLLGNEIEVIGNIYENPELTSEGAWHG